MKSVYLLAEIAGTRVALDSASIESVVLVPAVFPAPKADPSIAGLFALRSRVLTLIDSQYLVTGIPRPVAKGAMAAIAEISGHHYGLLVDRVFDVVAIDTDASADRIKPAPKWAALTKRTVQIDGELVLLLDLENMVIGTQSLAA